MSVVAAHDDRKRNVGRFRDNYQDEIDSAALYVAMAEREESPELAGVYGRLADIERRHAGFWASRLREAGADVPPARPSWRTRLLRRTVRWFGPRFVLPTVATLEDVNKHMYDDQPEAAATSLPADERSHARLLGVLAGTPRRGVSGGTVAALEGRHRAVGGNALRAAVLGANDGLTSNLALVMGVAGASAGSSAVLVAGLAGLLAGAFSMAIGEWVSVQSSRELYERQIAVEREELEQIPDEEREELSLIYQSKGLPPEEADELAARLMADPDRALDAMAREELGIDPDELGGSPWVAASASFLLFSLGAVVPLLPFLFLRAPSSGTVAVLAALVVSALGLTAIGAAITLLTNRSVWVSATRQLTLGLAAAGVTYVVGSAVGAAVG
ncbi:MAG: VIT1/CCC1 transporter family protein [Mycobacterium leprae]